MMNVSPSGLSLGGILEGYSDSTPGGIGGKQGVLDTILGYHAVYPGASPPRLGGRMGRDGNETPASVRDRLTPAREGSLGGRPVSTPI